MVYILFRDKEIFTTGEAARACPGVGQASIIRCIDQGFLEGYRVPGSRYRRIRRRSLLKFMRENGILTDALKDPDELHLNLLSGRGEIPPQWSEVVEHPPEHVNIRSSQSGFELGIHLAEAEQRGDIVHSVILDCWRRLRDSLEGETDLETTLEGLQRLKAGNDHFRDLTIALLHDGSIIDPGLEDHRYRRDQGPLEIIAHLRAEHDLEPIS